MKKITRLAIAVIAVGQMAAFAACSNNTQDSNKSAEPQVDKSGSRDTTVIINVGDTSKVELQSFTPSVNIRYIDMQLILEKYKYAVQEFDKLKKKDAALQQEQASLNAQDQKKQSEIAQKLKNNGYLSEESYNKDVQEYQAWVAKQSESLGKKVQGLAEETAKVQETIMKAIENYVAKYNETKKYDVILHKDAATYLNPALDITDEIIAGLNKSSK